MTNDGSAKDGRATDANPNTYLNQASFALPSSYSIPCISENLFKQNQEVTPEVAVSFTVCGIFHSFHCQLITLNMRSIFTVCRIFQVLNCRI